MNKGKYIVIEGPEGVGKTTQLHELARRLQAAGLPIRLLREPDSQSDLTARVIRQLTQDPRYPMNTRTEVLLYNAARSQSLQVIRQSVENGVTCLVDRNYLTTLAIQYYGRGDVPDYQTINSIINFAVGGMEPDMCIVLDAPVNTLRERLSHRGNGERFDNLDDAFLERVRAGYLWEAKQRNLPVLFATESAETVAESIWKLVSGQLAVRDTTAPAPVAPPVSIKEVIEQKQRSAELPAVSADQPTGDQTQRAGATSERNEFAQNTSIKNSSENPAEPQRISQIATNTDRPVYALKKQPSPQMTGQALAHISSNPNPLRITELKDLTSDKLAESLANGAFITEGISQLAAAHVADGRNVTLSQPPTFLTVVTEHNKLAYQYYVPGSLKGEVKQQYTEVMNSIYDAYAQMAAKLSDYLIATSKTPKKQQTEAWQQSIHTQAHQTLQGVLPAATFTNLGLSTSAQALQHLTVRLKSNDLPEVQSIGEGLAAEGRALMPELFASTTDDQVDELRAVHARMSDFAKAELPDNHAIAGSEAAILIDYWPKNELLLTADMLYNYTNLPVERLQNEISSWPYSQKVDTVKKYLSAGAVPGRALEKAHYSWDMLTDFATYRALQAQSMVDNRAAQALTPRYGYQMPQLIEAAGLSDQYESCFDASLRLHGLLQQAGLTSEAQYAVLMGHNVRWHVTCNSRIAFSWYRQLAAAPETTPGVRRLIMQMHEKVSEVHPIIAEAMQDRRSAKQAKQTTR